LEAELRNAAGRDYCEHGAAAGSDYRNGWRLGRLKAGSTSIKPHRSSSIYEYAPQSMIRKSGIRSSLGTNAKRLPGDHAQTGRRDHDPIQSNRIMI
jgi:hypothetical protein